MICPYWSSTAKKTEIHTYSKFLYGLSLILASEFVEFNKLRELLEQQGININNKNDIIQLGVNIINETRLLEQDGETIYNIINKLKDINYNKTTVYSIFKCNESRGCNIKDNYNIDNILRIVEDIIKQSTPQQEQIKQQTQMMQMGQPQFVVNDGGLGERFNETLKDYEVKHRKIIDFDYIKLKDTVQILR